MNLLHFIAATVLLVLGVEATIKNTTQEYRLKTDLKPGQSGKQRFSDLYLETYHTGAGLDDAVMVKNASEYIVGFLNGTNGQAGGVTCMLHHLYTLGANFADSHALLDQNQVFDINTTYPMIMVMDAYDTFYAAWQPVRINVGFGPSDPDENSGFWINGTGLQWSE